MPGPFTLGGIFLHSALCDALLSLPFPKHATDVGDGKLNLLLHFAPLNPPVPICWPVAWI